MEKTKKQKNSENVKNWFKNNPEKYKIARARSNVAAKKRNEIRRKTILQYYSKSEIPFCACCGENTYQFLSIDHKNNDGANHRREMRTQRRGSTDICWWIVKNNFPDIFQILCHNCNLAKGAYGVCPHLKEMV